MWPIARDVARSMCVCVLVTRVSCAKTAESIEMPFNELTQVGPKNMGSSSPTERGTFKGEICRRIVSYLRMSALRPPMANMPAHRTQRTNAFAAARVTERDAAFCQIILTLLLY